MYKHFIKHFFDFWMSLLAIVILLPFFILFTPIVALAMKGNPFFVQKRPGKKGKVFKMIKYRTMTNKRDESGNLLPDADRLTKFGKIMRKLSLDELPELFNILIGQMSFVGPRPQLVRDMVFFGDDAMRRQDVRPGLSGFAQVHGRNNITWHEKFDLDLQYIDKLSFGLDFKIIFQTIGKVVKGSDVATEGMETSEDYGDYLLRIGSISQEFYDEKQAEAKEILKNAR